MSRLPRGPVIEAETPEDEGEMVAVSLERHDQLAAFHCKRQEKEVLLVECLTGYMNAAALVRRASPCWRCKVGARNRIEWAGSRQDVTEMMERTLASAKMTSAIRHKFRQKNTEDG